MNTTPTHKQILNSSYMGWEYLGDGIFTRGDSIGYFLESGGWRYG